MKNWLIPTGIVALMIVGATAGAFASGEGDRGPTDESLPPVSLGGASTQPACEPGASECDDTLDTCGGIGALVDCDDPLLEPSDGDSRPIRSDDGIDLEECNLVHNINACDQDDFDRLGGDSLLPDEPLGEPGDPAEQVAGRYRVVVSHNTSVTQPDLDETAEFLRGFDAGLEFLVQESWPPTGVASVQTDTPSFCDAIFDTLASQSYIDDFSCGPQEIFNDVIEDVEDVPVVNVNDLP